MREEGAYIMKMATCTMVWWSVRRLYNYAIATITRTMYHGLHYTGKDAVKLCTNMAITLRGVNACQCPS